MATANSHAEYYGAIYPSPADTRVGIQYGDNFYNLTGTLDPGGGTNPTFPETTDVRRGKVFGYPDSQLVGVYDPADPSKVEQGYMYGANSVEFTGTGAPPPAATLPSLPPVNGEDQAKNIIRGDDYDPSVGDVPRWEIPAAFPIDAQTTAKFSARGDAGTIENIDVQIDTGSRVASMPLTREQTSRFVSSDGYRYDVQLTFASGAVKTLAYGALSVFQTYTDA